MNITPDNWLEAYREIRSDPAVSYDIKYTLQAALDRDPVDALNDAELVVRVLQARFDAMLGGKA